MTGLSAETFGLKDRGVVREGAFADLVVFDPDSIADRATFEKPKQTAAGIDLVIVNGTEAWADGKPTPLRNGRFISRA